MAAKIFRINYKSDFILTLNSDAGWMTPFCIKFWTGAPSQAFFAQWDGETYTHCAYDPSEPTKLLVQFDDHHLPIGELKYQVAYHFTVADFPNDTEDEVLNQANITTEIDGETYQVMLDFTGETAPEIQFSLPAYANEAQRIANEQQRITNEEQRIAAETVRIQNEQQRIAQEQIRQQNEQQRINQEQARVNEYAGLKADAVAATGAANDAAALANQKAQLAADKAALAQDASDLANAKAQLAADKAALAESAATLANQKAALAQQKAEYAQEQGTYSKNQGDYAKEQGDYSKAQGDYAKDQGDYSKSKGDYAKDQGDYSKQQGDYAKEQGEICAADHLVAVEDHQTAAADHQTATTDHSTALSDHTQAGNDHTRAESDHTRAESDHDAVELYVDSLGVFDLSKHNAVGGVLATYADLSAALTALNALDSQYKYGGMSFKFVQSSDNKYVQYRFLLSDSFTFVQFLTISNWQNENISEEYGYKNRVAISQNTITRGSFDKNIEADRKNGYELDIRGRYVVNASYNSSGDMYVSDDLLYDTDYLGNIFCYDKNDNYLGRVGAGNSLLTGTTHVRINWPSSYQTAPYFCTNAKQLQIPIKNLARRLEKTENTTQELEEQIIIVETLVAKSVKEVFDNINKEADFHEGYELAINGQYAVNANFDSSGNIPVAANLQYITDYKGYIYCYNGFGTYLDRVAGGHPLVSGTSFIRMNWQKTQTPPYFYAIDDNGIQSLFTKDYKVNGDDMLGYELSQDGRAVKSASWRTSRFIKLENGKSYICNRTANYYYYDGGLNYLGRVYTNANTVFNNSSYSDAVYMRTNAPISNVIDIYEVDANSRKILQRIVFKGSVDGKNYVNENYDSDINVMLPMESSNVEVIFVTNQSLYKQSETIELFRLGCLGKISLVPRTLSGDSIYCDRSEANISVVIGNSQQTIPLRLNNYGKDLFSMRIKYPVVNVALDGTTSMITPMPSEYQGMYIEKTSTQFVIHNGDDSVFKSWTLANYTDVDAFVEALKSDTDVTDVFEIKKYGCEGSTFSQINNFDKILLCKEHQEIYYEQGAGTPSYTGNVYWDSYPTYIRTSDIGYKHVLKMSYKIVNGAIRYVQVSIDGMFVRFKYSNMGFVDIKLTANMDIISQILEVKTLPYNPIKTPMLSMQHILVEGDTLLQKTGKTTTMRQYDVLSYLKQKGFVAQNFSECAESIQGGLAIERPTYCLTFDDTQKNIWTNKVIRDIFNEFGAKPTLVYIFYATDLDNNTTPDYALTNSEYKQAKASKWDIISHGFCLKTDLLSYAQFYQGFIKTKEAWLRWYGEDVQVYNPHGDEIVDYQYYLLKHMGFSTIASGSAALGWYCECGTTVDVQFKRVTWMDSEQSWNVVTSLINEWIDI